MYLCEVCQACTRSGQQRLVHVIERRVPLGNGPCWGRPRNFPALQQLGAFRTEIARELSVCPKCKDRLERGDSLATLLTLARVKREEAAKAQEQQPNGQPASAVDLRPRPLPKTA